MNTIPITKAYLNYKIMQADCNSTQSHSLLSGRNRQRFGFSLTGLAQNSWVRLEPCHTELKPIQTFWEAQT